MLSKMSRDIAIAFGSIARMAKFMRLEMPSLWWRVAFANIKCAMFTQGHGMKVRRVHSMIIVYKNEQRSKLQCSFSPVYRNRVPVLDVAFSSWKTLAATTWLVSQPYRHHTRLFTYPKKITGTRCKHEFCWQCLAPYGPIKQHGNTGHVNTCRYHSQNLPATALLNPQAFFPNGWSRKYFTVYACSVLVALKLPDMCAYILKLRLIYDVLLNVSSFHHPPF